MDKSFLNDIKNKLNIEELKTYIKELREKIIKCLDEERKTNVELDKRLYEVEMDMFRDVVKGIDSYFEYPYEYPSKLRDLIWLYSSLMDIDRKMEYMNIGISYLKVMRE